MPYDIIGIGETLWDIFPDGPRFGGAPANFACSVAELAQDSARVCVVSAVGDDELGHDALDALRARRVDTSTVRIDNRATGRVLVELDDAGVASYRFEDNAAWDHLVWSDDLRTVAEHCDAVCFGTLGQRSEVSRDTIRAFVQAMPDAALRIFDVNLREPFYDNELIDQSLSLANVLKLNDDELPVVARLGGCSGGDVEVMRQLVCRYELRYVALTRGADGAVIVSIDAVSDHPGVAIDVADTVGAGDAFTAAMTLGLLSGDHIEVVSQNAIAAATYVCSQPGATMSFPQHLRHNDGH